MGRDGIKIVEFDRDDDLSRAARPNEKKGIKIIEFDNDRDDSREGSRKTVATARDIGPIKIVEFDDDGPSGPSGASGPSSAPETPRPAARAIKIRDFGEEAEAGRRSGTSNEPKFAGSNIAGSKIAGSKIKVMEFD